MSIDEFILEKKYDGDFSEIYEGTKKGSNESFSITKLNKQKFPEKELNLLKEGMNTLRDINHPNIIKLINVIEDTNNYYYIFENYMDDDLENYLRKNNEPLSEEIVQFIMKQVISAVKYLHDKKIMHRDIKLNNLFIKYNSEEDSIKMNILNSKIILGGFNFSTHFKKSEEIYLYAGTPAYISPQIATYFPYDEKTDIWSLGVCCFRLLYKKLPFPYNNNAFSYHNRIKYDLKNPLSEEANSFIDRMLEINDKKRASAFELSKHEFLDKNFLIKKSKNQ